jgi:hypothetical protein
MTTKHASESTTDRYGAMPAGLYGVPANGRGQRVETDRSCSPG